MFANVVVYVYKERAFLRVEGRPLATFLLRLQRVCYWFVTVPTFVLRLQYDLYVTVARSVFLTCSCNSGRCTENTYKTSQRLQIVLSICVYTV